MKFGSLLKITLASFSVILGSCGDQELQNTSSIENNNSCVCYHDPHKCFEYIDGFKGNWQCRPYKAFGVVSYCARKDYWWGGFLSTTDSCNKFSERNIRDEINDTLSNSSLKDSCTLRSDYAWCEGLSCQILNPTKAKANVSIMCSSGDNCQIWWNYDENSNIIIHLGNEYCKVGYKIDFH